MDGKFFLDFLLKFFYHHRNFESEERASQVVNHNIFVENFLFEFKLFWCLKRVVNWIRNFEYPQKFKLKCQGSICSTRKKSPKRLIRHIVCLYDFIAIKPDNVEIFATFCTFLGVIAAIMPIIAKSPETAQLRLMFDFNTF